MKLIHSTSAISTSSCDPRGFFFFLGGADNESCFFFGGAATVSTEEKKGNRRLKEQIRVWRNDLCGVILIKPGDLRMNFWIFLHTESCLCCFTFHPGLLLLHVLQLLEQLSFLLPGQSDVRSRTRPEPEHSRSERDTSDVTKCSHPLLE